MASTLNNQIARNKFLGALLGAAIGDAVGNSVGNTIYEWEEVHRQVAANEIESLIRSLPNLRYTDDTHMTIGVAESLRACKGFDAAHMAQRFVANYDKEPWRGYAPGPPEVFRLIKSGQPWDKAAADVYPDGSFGNGAAMRVSPLGLFFWDKHAQLVEAVYHASRITHQHALGIEGAILQAISVALAVEEIPSNSLDTQLFISNLLGYATEEFYRTKIANMESLLACLDDKQKIVEQLGHGVEAFNSVPTAIFAFLANPQSFISTVTYAVSLGGDTDTIASMAGAISGAYLGIDAIPNEWLKQLENRDYIFSLARKLWQTMNMR
ncbi:ADP-ribosylglycohydrolase family protein [Chloroflexota bacterium]